MIFKSRMSIFFKILIFGSLILMVTVIILSWLDPEMRFALKFWLTFLLLAISGFLIWAIRKTMYEITPEFLHYQFGPMVGKIPIQSIKSLEVNKTLWAGNKPAMATQGIIVKYNSYDEVYISPQTNETFVEEILKVNPKIQVNRH